MALNNILNNTLELDPDMGLSPCDMHLMLIVLQALKLPVVPLTVFYKLYLGKHIHILTERLYCKQAITVNSVATEQIAMTLL